MQAPFCSLGLAAIGINFWLGQCYGPERFPRIIVLEAYLSLGCRADLACPFDAEPPLIRAVTEPDDLANFDSGLNALQAGAFTTDVDGKDIFGKRTAILVGAEDTNREPDLGSWLPTLTHMLERIPPLRNELAGRLSPMVVQHITFAK